MYNRYGITQFNTQSSNNSFVWEIKKTSLSLLKFQVLHFQLKNGFISFLLVTNDSRKDLIH